MQPFIVKLIGLAPGKTEFSWKADAEFFEKFDNSEIIKADLDVTGYVEKSGSFIGVDCSVNGSVTVPCDRCLDDLDLPVETSFALSIKFGEQEGSAEADDREIIMVPYGETEYDLSQAVYDYVLLSLPMQRVHEDGGCNEETIKFLSK